MREESATTPLVELAQRTVDAANEGDFDALLSLCAPDAVWDPASADLAGERFEGGAAIRSHFEEWFRTLEDMELEADEIRDVGNGIVFSRCVQRGRPSGATASVEFRFATISVWAGGRIRENWVYTDVDAARDAAKRLAQEKGTMSDMPAIRDLVERWKQAAEAAERSDFDAVMSIYAPDAVWDASPAGVGIFEGVPAIRNFLEDWIGDYEEYEYHQEEGLDLGNEVTFVVGRVDGRPTGSTGRVRERWAFTSVWTEGILVRVTVGNDIDEARAAAERLAQERG